MKRSTMTFVSAALLPLAAMLLTLTGCHSMATYRFKFDRTSHIQRGISVSARPDYDGVRVTLQNWSPRAIKILWDESSFIDLKGVAHPIMHSGVKFVLRTQSQIPTTIPSGARIEQRIVATDFVTYGATSSGKKWRIQDHLPRGVQAKAAVGKRVRLYLMVADEQGSKWPLSIAIKVQGVGSPSYLRGPEMVLSLDTDRQHAYLQ